MPLHLFFFYATILLLPTQLGYHFWPDWALVLGRRVDYLSPTIYLTDITIILTLLFWFLKRRTMYDIRCKNLRINSKSLFISLFLCLFISLNIFLAFSPMIAFYKWFKVLEFVLFGLYIIKTKPSLSRSLWCLSFAVFYSSLIAITQFFLQHSVGSFLWFLGERTFSIDTPGIARTSFQMSAFSFQIKELLRPYATFPHPNVLGGFLAITLPLIIFSNGTTRLPAGQVKQCNNWTIILLKIFRVATIALGSFALILTFSRSAWIAGILGIIIIIFYKFYSLKNFKYKSIHSLLFIGFVVFVGFIGLVFALPYFRSLTPDSESVFVRNELARSAFSMWKTSPFFGVGLGNFLVELPKYYPHREIFFLQPVHNIYLLILSETGIIGFTIVLYLLFMFFKHIVLKHLFSIWHVAFGIALLLGVVDHYPLTLQQGQLLLTILIAFLLF